MPLSTISNPESRHQPSPQAISITKEVVSSWREKHPILNEGENIKLNTDWLEYTLASRIRSWIGPQSVIAGTKDLVNPFLKRSIPTLENVNELMDDLAESFAKRLMDEQMLTATPKRSRSLGD